MRLMPDTVHVAIKRLEGFTGPLPGYESEHAAGMDVRAWLPDGSITIQAGGRQLVPTGFSMAVPVGYEAQIRPRSGLATKHGLSMPNSPGTIDADYRGQVFVAMINLGDVSFEIEHGMRVAQMLIKPVPVTVWDEVATLPDTERGAGGFGHTGHA